MANLPEVSQFDNVYQIEVTDPVQGGVSGVTNTPLKNLTNRTKWLKDQMELLAKCGFIPNGSLNPIVNTEGGPNTDWNLLAADAGKLIIITDGDVDNVAPLSLRLPTPVSGTDNNTYAILNASSVPMPVTAVTGTIYDPKSVGTWAGIVEAGDFVMIANTPALEGAASGAIATSAYVVLFTDTLEASNQAGMISYFALSNAPRGWLKANGQAVSRTGYAKLFAAIGTRFGVGNGSTTFNLPDLRAEFLRGLDDGRAVDTNSFVITGTRTNGSALITVTDTALLFVGMAVAGSGIPSGATVTAINSSTSFTMSAAATLNGASTISVSGRPLGSYQAQALQAHTHGILQNGNDAITPTGGTTNYRPGGDTALNGVTGSTGGTETRPRNVAMLACIKF
jgi:microcystin-dependent protein